MKDIAIFGAGGFGREVASMVTIINQKEQRWNIVGFFDDGVEKGKQISHFGPVLGGMADLNNWDKEIDIAIAIGNPMSLRGVRERITNKNVSFPNIIYPDFFVYDPKTFSIGKGNIINRGCSCTCNVTIGDFNVINGYIGFGHDDIIGNYNIIMPSVNISGEVTLGDCNLLGVGSIILQQIKIGNNVCLGAGAVLLTKPKDGNTYIGNPAKVFKY